ncbi:PP0621 family protein [Ideonella sp. B508-1]|uniref:PP0621 family protein n=1 Tax=Ideonella sp. B508-1 TaxID=137716 RepID=UPI000344E7C9|nr:PP0621 family protein [Ideonella sp. B508-1]
MARILLLLGLLVLALFWALGRRRDGAGSAKAGPGPVGAPPGPMPMVACAHCGLHLAQAEAVQDAEGRWFCSEDHRAQGARGARG